MEIQKEYPPDTLVEVDSQFRDRYTCTTLIKLMLFPDGT